MKVSLPTGCENKLIWWPELGMGYHPQEPMNYDGDYWAKYLEYDKTQMGLDLTKARCDMVNRHAGRRGIVDIGIGGGLFVRTLDCYGYDVNKEANEWLFKSGKFRNPYARKVRGITCWDSLEHIPDPTALLNNVEEWVFASIPVFLNGEQVTQSKHYRPGEHIWYWTHEGFVQYMFRMGFNMLEHNRDETELGREDIGSYTFKRFKYPWG